MSLREKIKEKVRGFKDRIRDWTADLYGPDDLAAMNDGMGTVEVILIIVEKPNAKHRYVLCGK